MMTKLIRSLVLMVCFLFVLPVTIFANGVNNEQKLLVESVPVDTVTANEVILNKQSEIDQYVFEEHIEEIENKGFTVTHTSSLEEYVEIGITPFNEENEQYLYSIFGKDQVKVVEGQQAELFTIAEEDTRDIDIIIENQKENESKEGLTKYLIILGISIVLLGGVVVAKRNIKTVKN